MPSVPFVGVRECGKEPLGIDLLLAMSSGLLSVQPESGMDDDHKAIEFTEEQMVGLRREHEAGAKAADLCRKYEMPQAPAYHCDATFGRMNVSDTKRLWELGLPNAKLKKLLGG